MRKDQSTLVCSIAFSMFLQREISPLAKCVISHAYLPGGRRAKPEKTIKH